MDAFARVLNIFRRLFDDISFCAMNNVSWMIFSSVRGEKIYIYIENMSNVICIFLTLIFCSWRMNLESFVFGSRYDRVFGFRLILVK